MEVKNINPILARIGVLEYMTEVISDQPYRLFTSTDYIIDTAQRVTTIKIPHSKLEDILSILELVYLKEDFPILENEWNKFVNLARLVEV